MKRQVSIMLSLIAMVMMMTGCSQPSIVGTWQAKNADLKKMFGAAMDDANAKLQSGTFTLEVTEANIIENAEMTITYSEDGTSVDVTMTAKATFSYTREGDLVKMKYLSHHFDIKDITYDEETEQAIAASGASKEDIKKEMLAEMNGDSDSNKDESFIIKSLDENKMTVEDTDGVSEFIRLN